MILRYTTNYEFQSLGACVLGTVRLRAQPTSEEAAPIRKEHFSVRRNS